MSKAFVKDDASDEQIIVAARAPLPQGAHNYVTPRGMALLEKELAELSAERARLQSDASGEGERARQLTVLRERLSDLEGRLASAEVIRDAPQGEVAFGTTVRANTLTGKFAGEALHFTIVGVDEAASGEGVAFTAPIARVLLGLKVGDKARLELASGEQLLEVVEVAYESNSLQTAYKGE